eukprot:m.274402 g.274402  ORF g.274402 m.274402 type:complete len:552 (+) comp26895_c2_seq20:5195-6850(+)
MGVTDKQWVQSTILEAAQSSPELFDRSDLESIKNNPTYLDRFIEARSSKEDSLKMVLSTLRWRSEFRPDAAGGDDTSICSTHMQDKDGNPVIVLNYRNISGVSDETESAAERAIASTLEGLSAQIGTSSRVSLLIDARKCNPSTFSMRVAQFLMTCFGTYYPCLLGPILLYGLPWGMRSTWGLVRNTLRPGCVSSVRALSDIEALCRHIDRSNICPSITHDDRDAAGVGGALLSPTCDGVAPEGLASSLRSGGMRSPLSDSGRRVTFAQTSPGPGEIPQTQIAVLSPSKEIVFVGDTVLAVSLTIRNTSDEAIAFKIKTTSPTSYRVRPNNGVLAVGATATIDVSRRSISPLNEPFRDKFLVMITKAGMIDVTHTHEAISDFFRTLARGQITEFRLYTNYTGGATPPPSAAGAAAARALIAEAEVNRSYNQESKVRLKSPRNSGVTKAFIANGGTAGEGTAERPGSGASTTRVSTPTPKARGSPRLSNLLAALLFIVVGWMGATLTQFPATAVAAAGANVVVAAVVFGILLGIALDLLRLSLSASRRPKQD